MDPRERFIYLKYEYVKCRNAERRAEIERESAELFEKYPVECSEAYEEILEAAAGDIDNERVKTKIKELSEIVSMSYIAKRYFHKSGSWLSQRVNGNTHNGKPSAFTREDIVLFNHALKDIAKHLESVNLLSRE